MKLKILHFSQFLGVGGLEKVLFLLIKEQIKAGHEVELVIYDYEQSWVEYFRTQGIKVDTSFRKGRGYDRKFLKYVSKKSKSFDIVHTHDLNPLMYVAVVKFLHTLTFRKFPKLIHSAHGMDHLNRQRVYKLYERLCSKQIDKIIGVSPAVCDYYYGFGVPKHKVVNINNGTLVKYISPHEFKTSRASLRSSLGLESGQKIWVSVARVIPLKDQKIICELAKQIPDTTFLIVGPSGDDKYWNEIELIKPSNVLMLGSRSDISEILMGSDYFISASKHEGIPISVLEAGAIGIPCLLSNIPGHQVIQEGNHETIAMFFTPSDIIDLTEKAKLIHNNKSLADSLGVALHLHVKEKFSSTKMYERNLEVYLG